MITTCTIGADQKTLEPQPTMPTCNADGLSIINVQAKYFRVVEQNFYGYALPAGEDLYIMCQYDDLKFQPLYVTGSTSFRHVVSDGVTKIDGTDYITIRNASKNHSGRYRCQDSLQEDCKDYTYIQIVGKYWISSVGLCCCVETGS